MKAIENFKQDVTLESILHLFFSEPSFYLNGKEIKSLNGLDLNSTMVTCIYTDYLGNLTLELEEEQTTEELGVLQSKNNKNYYMARKSQVGLYIMTQSLNHAFKLTRKEAEQFPRFKFVSLKELENKC